MKRALMLLIVLILSLLISGCPGKLPPVEPNVIIKTVYIFNKCATPNPPNYLEMSNTSHLGSAFNINILVGNALKMKTYNTSLLKSLECYDKQTIENNPSGEIK